MALKITKNSKLDTPIEDYINYWDGIIEQWLQNNFNCSELKEQELYGKALGIENDSFNNRLPEPYWGDPYNCSFVIMNYNPGPCQDSRHNYRFCATANNCMIHEIKRTKYSDFAMSFPLYRDLKTTELWFEDSIGRRWWQNQKKKWINDLLKALGTQKLPFAMEFCSWHSDYWHGINDRKFRINLNLIERKVFTPFKEAIRGSGFSFGLCFGKNIGKEFLDRFVILNKLSIILKKNNYTLYSFESRYYIINYWDDGNHRNRYPKSGNDIFMILSNQKLI